MILYKLDAALTKGSICINFKNEENKMVTLKIITRDGDKHEIEGNVGDNLMEAIRDSEYGDLLAICGGCCSCATCHVYVASDYTDKSSKVSEDEDDLLDSSDHRQELSRLSCQVVLTEEYNGMEVIIAPED